MSDDALVSNAYGQLLPSDGVGLGGSWWAIQDVTFIHVEIASTY